MFTRQVLTIGVLMTSAAVALAGTKYQANLVPASATNPPPNPTMTSKGKVKLDDKASLKVGLKGVTDGGGVLVTSSTSLKDTGDLDGTEYIVILKATFTALGTPIEAPIPVALKNGNGSGSASLGALIGLIPAGTGRSIEVTGGEVWGPLGAGTLAACQADVDTGYSLTPGSPNCRGGSKIGVAGINIP